MKQFLIKIFLFILPWLILAYPLDVFLSNQLKKSNEAPGEFEVMNDIYAGKVDCEIAVYGSSRAWVHINPNTIEEETGFSAYNFGIDGHNFWIQYLRHLEYLKYNEKPKTILLSVDVYTFQKEKNLYYKEQFLPYMLWNNNLREYTSSYNTFSALEYFIPAIRYAGKREVLNTCLEQFQNKGEESRYRENGFRTFEKSWNNDFAKAVAAEEFYTAAIHPASVLLLERFLDECKEDNIELIMVYTPEHILGQDYIVNRDEIFKIFNRVSKENDIPFLDYSDHEMCQDTSYFYNASHLNSKGTEMFNPILSADLKRELTN